MNTIETILNQLSKIPDDEVKNPNSYSNVDIDCLEARQYLMENWSCYSVDPLLKRLDLKKPNLRNQLYYIFSTNQLKHSTIIDLDPLG